mgnify:CR=1 FL=1
MSGQIADENRLLRSLVRGGLIEQVPDRGPRFGSNDRIYRLTDAGVDALGRG